MTTLILATGNAHKVEEIRSILGERFSYKTLQDFPSAPKTIEDGHTFEANATKKAVELAKWIGTNGGAGEGSWVLADDSGLEVDALAGAPGVHSARFTHLDSGQEGNSPDSANNEKLLRLLANIPEDKRTARFRCVLALTPVLPIANKPASSVCDADEHELATQLFSGACEGRIISGERGAKGFGYDPLFIPNGHTKTFAELGSDVKNRLSHRAKALEKLKTFWDLRTASASHS
jgi:XTP/dITP diphosphohydrolase